MATNHEVAGKMVNRIKIVSELWEEFQELKEALFCGASFVMWDVKDDRWRRYDRLYRFFFQGRGNERELYGN